MANEDSYDNKLTLELSQIQDINLSAIGKMTFIYNALQTGWTVKKIAEDKYEFHKELDENSRHQICMSDFLKQFVLLNMRLALCDDDHL